MPHNVCAKPVAVKLEIKDLKENTLKCLYLILTSDLVI